LDQSSILKKKDNQLIFLKFQEKLVLFGKGRYQRKVSVYYKKLSFLIHLSVLNPSCRVFATHSCEFYLTNLLVLPRSRDLHMILNYQCHNFHFFKKEKTSSPSIFVSCLAFKQQYIITQFFSEQQHCRVLYSINSRKKKSVNLYNKQLFTRVFLAA
jgi:hypothetical protein